MSNNQSNNNLITNGSISPVNSVTTGIVLQNSTTTAIPTFHASGTIIGSYGYIQSDKVITLANGGKELVSLDKNGKVTWANDIELDEAAEAFEKLLVISAELKAGISQTVKLKMRDSIFESLIGIAKEKGSLTADDLTYLLEASKIVEKLKG